MAVYLAGLLAELSIALYGARRSAAAAVLQKPCLVLEVPPMICGTCLKNPGTTHYAAITSLIAANAKNANSCKQSTYIIGGITQYLGIITQILGESARLRLTVF